MTQPSRVVGDVARRLADQISRQVAAPPQDRFFHATVATVTAGAASDGNARVTVTWRGAALTASGYAASYTPVVGHRVLCVLADGQLSILHRSVGYP